jgi:flagellin-like hook-associated protein FlgL
VNGAEFQINTTTNGNQGVHETYNTAGINTWNNPVVGSLTNGGFVAAWTSENQDGDGYGVFGQIYAPDGSSVGSEFLINTEVSADQYMPAITSLSNGGFVVTWAGTEDHGGYDHDIFAQAFQADGSKIGEEFQVNTFDESNPSNGQQTSPAVATLNDGKLVFIWNTTVYDGDGYGVFAQIFDTGTSSSSGSSSSSSSSSSSGSSSSSEPTLDRPSNAMAAITAIDNAIQTVNIQRSKLGAVSNRLSHTVKNLTNISANLSAARGGIGDADFAMETTDLAKTQILQQASTAMLAQANASKQNVLSLLQG